MGCTSFCGTREWRDLPYAHATGHTHCISSAPLHVCVVCVCPSCAWTSVL